jgi:hypothetical protein
MGYSDVLYGYSKFYEKIKTEEPLRCYHRLQEIIEVFSISLNTEQIFLKNECVNRIARRLNNQSGTYMELRIPATVRIGVTGHRKFDNEEVLDQTVKSVLSKLDTILSHTPHAFVVLSSLAEGADRLVVREVLNWSLVDSGNKPVLEVVLPMPKEDYLQEFEMQESRDEFEGLIAGAQSVKAFEKVEPLTTAYERAGRYIVENCDVLIAIWDGKPAAGQGGTAEIVDYARELGRSLSWINSESGELQEERHEDRTLEALAYHDAYNTERMGDLELSSTIEDHYTTLTNNAERSGGLTVDVLAPLRNHLLPQFVRADLLAERYQDRYLKAGSAVYALAAAAVATVTIQALFFAHIPELLWFEVAEIALILLFITVSHSGEWHRKWLDYRFLAERLRAALFLNVAGIECELPTTPPHLSLAHRPNDWMVKAFLRIWESRPKAPFIPEIPFEPLKNLLLEAWIGEQISFYTKTSHRSRRRYTFLARDGIILFFLTFVAATLHATGFGHSWLPTFSVIPSVLAAIAIIFPAIGASLTGIRVQREYRRNAERYDNIAHHLTTISTQIKQERDQKTVIGLLERANEVMLRENQDWRVVILFQKLELP